MPWLSNKYVDCAKIIVPEREKQLRLLRTKTWSSSLERKSASSKKWETATEVASRCVKICAAINTDPRTFQQTKSFALTWYLSSSISTCAKQSVRNPSRANSRRCASVSTEIDNVVNAAEDFCCAPLFSMTQHKHLRDGAETDFTLFDTRARRGCCSGSAKSFTVTGRIKHPLDHLNDRKIQDVTAVWWRECLVTSREEARPRLN